jgi:hypothetical protein
VAAKPKARNPLEPKVRQLEAEVARLEEELRKAHTILDVQEKVRLRHFMWASVVSD